MATPPHQAYAVACGQLATLLSISLAAARRKVDLQAAREGLRQTSDKVSLAERMQEAARQGSGQNGLLLDALLGAEEDEANYLGDD